MIKKNDCSSFKISITLNLTQNQSNDQVPNNSPNDEHKILTRKHINDLEGHYNATTKKDFPLQM